MTVEIDGADRAAGDDALAVIATAVEIDLVAPVDRVLRTHLDARITARAQIEIDRVFLHPSDVERAEPAGELRELSRMDRIGAFRRQFRAGGATRQDDGHGEARGQRMRAVQRRVRGTDDQELAF